MLVNINSTRSVFCGLIALDLNFHSHQISHINMYHTVDHASTSNSFDQNLVILLNWRATSTATAVVCMEKYSKSVQALVLILFICFATSAHCKWHTCVLGLLVDILRSFLHMNLRLVSHLSCHH
jgi:hypothetical protein